MPDGVLGDVAQAPHEVAVVANKPAVETAAKDVPAHPVAVVECASVVLVNGLEAGTQVGRRCAEENVDVVRHQAERQNAPPPLSDFACDEPQIASAVMVVVE
jgi:hypothetical protein